MYWRGKRVTLKKGDQVIINTKKGILTISREGEPLTFSRRYPVESNHELLLLNKPDKVSALLLKGFLEDLLDITLKPEVTLGSKADPEHFYSFRVSKEW